MNSDQVESIVRRIVVSLRTETDLAELERALTSINVGVAEGDERKPAQVAAARVLHSSGRFTASARDRDSGSSAQKLALVKDEPICLKGVHSRLLSLHAQGHDASRITQIINHEQNLGAGVEQVRATLAELSKNVGVWANTVLEPVYLNVYVGFRDIRVQVGDAVLSRRAFYALGVDLHGYRSLLGVWVCETDATRFWRGLGNDLKARGVQDIMLLLLDVDGSCGDGFESVFPAVRMQVHLRDVTWRSMQYVPKMDGRALRTGLKMLSKAEDEAAAAKLLADLARQWGERYPYVFNYWQLHWPMCCWQLSKPPMLRRAMHMDTCLDVIARVFNVIDRYPQPFVDNTLAAHSIYMLLADAAIAWQKPVVNWRVLLNEFLRDHEPRLRAFL
jgi:transposase-like protein